MLTYFCVENVPEFQYCFWLFTDVDYFYVQNVPIIFDWCLCDFLVLKHIDEVYTLHLHLSLTDVDIFFVENILEFQYCFWLLTDVDYFSCVKSSYHSQLMSMWFSCTETYSWSVCTSSSFIIYWCWDIFVLKMFQNFNIVFDYILILTIFHVQNVLIIFDWCLCDFLVLKHIDEVYALHLHFLFTDVDIFFVSKIS